MAEKGLSEEEIGKIEELFGNSFTSEPGIRSLKLENPRTGSKISMDIFNDNEGNCLVSVYTSNAHLQLQNCTRAIISTMLEEVIFVSETGEHISGMIISKNGDCSMYANVNRSLLNADFTELTSEKLLAAVALSVAENGD